MHGNPTRPHGAASAVGRDTEEIITALEEAEEKGIVGIDGHRMHFTHPVLGRTCTARALWPTYEDCTGASPKSSTSPSSVPDISPWLRPVETR